MSDIRCEKCGETLKADALSCWACGTLTPAGRQAREAAGGGDDEEWRQAAQAARQRQAQRPAVDPDEALKRVLAETGDELPSAQRRPEVVLEVHRDNQLIASAQTLSSLGALLAFLIALGGLLAAVVGILSGGLVALLAGLAGFVAVGGLALHVFFQARFMSELGLAQADTLHQVRRLQFALEEHERQEHTREQEQP